MDHQSYQYDRLPRRLQDEIDGQVAQETAGTAQTIKWELIAGVGSLVVGGGVAIARTIVERAGLFTSSIEGGTRPAARVLLGAGAVLMTHGAARTKRLFRDMSKREVELAKKKMTPPPGMGQTTAIRRDTPTPFLPYIPEQPDN